MLEKPCQLFLVLLLVALPLVSQTGPAGSEGSTEQYRVKMQMNVKLPMRDGVELAVDIYRPDAPGRFPVLLMRTYWGKTVQSKIQQALYYASRGYVVALADIRGRYDSDGQWDPYKNDPKDGYDTQDWLGKQSWSNGKLGLFGSSYEGFAELMPAPLQSPYVKCVVPLGCQQTNFGHLYNDGVLQLNVIFTAGLFFNGRTMQANVRQLAPGAPQVVDYDVLFRTLPLISAADEIVDAPYIREWITHSRYDDYWKSYGIKEKYADITVPAYFLTGWYDNLVHETFRNFQGFREQGGSASARQDTKLIVGPWSHGAWYRKAISWDHGITYPGFDVYGFQLRWYDYWLKGIQNGVDQEPPIKIFVMGANEWRSENEWPLARTKWTSFYLRSSGKANSLEGDGSLSLTEPSASGAQDRFVYDPENPVTTLGGQISTHGEIQGARDRTTVQKRADVLVYTSEPLESDLEVTGPVQVELYASSSAVDTDFTATLSDVYPDGAAIHICEGVRGARFRESLENPTLIEPGKVYRYTIDLWETSNVFKAGHRLRLDISSSNFPRFARNQNIGEPFGMSVKVNKAEQTIFHDAKFASRLILPVIP